MKRLFKKIASLFLTVSLFFALTSFTEAMEYVNFECRIISDRMLDGFIEVGIDERLNRYRHTRGNRYYNIDDWFTIWANLVVESLPPHIDCRKISRIVFQTEAPPETACTFVSHEPWEVYLVDRGAALVVVCRSLEEVERMDAPLLREGGDERIRTIRNLLVFCLGGFGYTFEGGES
ncbi:MAG: hypothetical protein Q4D57_04530 [Clostridia bacterium]|nr:hypothetical protein [Clostridia bacterium]